MHQWLIQRGRKKYPLLKWNIWKNDIFDQIFRHLSKKIKRKKGQQFKKIFISTSKTDISPQTFLYWQQCISHILADVIMYLYIGLQEWGWPGLDGAAMWLEKWWSISLALGCVSAHRLSYASCDVITYSEWVFMMTTHECN